MAKFSIMEITNKVYLTNEVDGKYIFGKEEDRIIFYDEADAENVLEFLNDETDLCCVLLNEDSAS